MVQGASQGCRYKIFSDIPAYRQAGLSDHGAFERRLRECEKIEPMDQTRRTGGLEKP